MMSGEIKNSRLSEDLISEIYEEISWVLEN